MKKLIAIAAVTATVLSMLVAGSSPAAAHETDWIAHGYDSAYVHADHQTVTVCDNEPGDGHYAYAELRSWYAGDPVYDREADGDDAGCDTETFLVFEYTEFRLCEEGKGCSQWYWT